MRKKMKKVIGFMLCFMLVLGMMPGSLTVYADGHIHNEVTFEEWTSNNSLPTSAGSYYLTSDVTINSTWDVPSGTTNLCLNGHGIIMNSNNIVIIIGSNEILNLYDCGTTEHKYTISNSTDNNSAGLAMVNDATGTKTFTGGYITGGKYSTDYKYGAGIFIQNGELNMYGGTIIGNQIASNVTGGGGGVELEVDGKFNMYGGNIIGNEAPYGGGVYVRSGEFNLYSGSIEKNVSTTIGGGGVCLYGKGSFFNMKDGEIRYNSAFCGGGISSSGSSTVTVKGGVISHNYATESGGGLGNERYEESDVSEKNANIIISGDPLFSENKAGTDDHDSNIELVSNAKITVDAQLTNTIPIGIRMEAPGVFTNSTNTEYNVIDNFTSDDTNYGVGIKDDSSQLYLGKYIVTFDKNGHGDNETQSVLPNNFVIKPIDPTADGYIFGGWYMDEWFTREYFFDQWTVNNNMTLYAKWTAKEKEKTVVKTKPTAKSLTYTGSGQELVNGGAAENGTLQYALGEDDSEIPTDGWSEDIPTAIDAGDYYVWYRVEADANYADTDPDVVEVTIAKAESKPTIPKEFTTGFSAEKGQTLADIKLPKADNGTWKWEEPETTKLDKVGENKFTAIFVPEDTENYEESKVEVVINVENPKEPEKPTDDSESTEEPTEEPIEEPTEEPTEETKDDKNGFVNDDDINKEETGITGVVSTDLDDYAKAQDGSNVQVNMKVSSQTAKSLNSETAAALKESVDDIFDGMNEDNVKNEYLDIKITKSVDGGASEEVHDLGRVIEIELSYDLNGKYNPVIFREHNGEVVKFTRLNSRTTGNNKEDATYYVDEENHKIYIYSQFFSTFSIAYTTVPSYQITFDDGNGNITQKMIANGATIAEPATPTREGYKFLGWYVGDDKYDFTTPVTGKLTLTAKWEKIIPPVVNVLVSKQKVFGRSYFEKYGEEPSNYKYKFKVDDKSQKKILSATKDMIKAKDTGTAKVALYRKAKGGSWEKIEEHEFIVEKPEVTKKVDTLHAGDTAEAMSFVTNKMSVNPTYFLSSKPEVAEVDFETGKIKVLKTGSTTITIAYDNGIRAAKYKTKLVIK